MSHLTSQQRYTIFALLNNGFKQKDIALAIDKDPSVVSREISRNKDKRNGKYNHHLAQHKADLRKKAKPKFIRFTVEIKQLVDSLLSDYFSPEQICGRIKLLKGYIVSIETIYRYIWEDKRKGGCLYTYLRRNGRRYSKRGNYNDSRGTLKNQVSIDERPSIVDEKQRFGDLEIDTVIGKKHKGVLLTINDRCTGILWIRKLSSKEAESLADETIKALMPFKGLIHTITADNGKEFACHERIAKELGVNVYFAHPYHSWERGANENTNGLIRQFFPKGSDIENLSIERILIVQDRLNDRPRKRLGYLSPNEKYKNIINQKLALVG